MLKRKSNTVTPEEVVSQILNWVENNNDDNNRDGGDNLVDLNEEG